MHTVSAMRNLFPCHCLEYRPMNTPSNCFTTIFQMQANMFVTCVAEAPVIFFVTCSPVRMHAAESINTLMFGRRCRKIELGMAKANAELVPKRQQLKVGKAK